tara:strand:+ start:2710 stop:2967 length:258 start_codon:yes stop_codon:yes gene_type:complete
MAKVTLSLEEYQDLMRQLSAHSPPPVIQSMMLEGERQLKAKKKRRPSKYNKEFAKQYKAMRKKHPRMTHGQITSKAHKAAKKALK